MEHDTKSLWRNPKILNADEILFVNAMKAAWRRKLGRKNVKHLNLVLPEELYRRIEQTAAWQKEPMQTVVLDMIKTQLPVSRFNSKEKSKALKKSHEYAANQNKIYQKHLGKLMQDCNYWEDLYKKTLEELDQIKNSQNSGVPGPKKTVQRPKVDTAGAIDLSSSFPATEEGVADHIEKPRRFQRL